MNSYMIVYYFDLTSLKSNKFIHILFERENITESDLIYFSHFFLE